MWQTLVYIPREIAGYPVFGFGLLLAAWVALSVVLLAWLVWRQGLTADTWGYVPLMLLVAAVIAWLLPALCEPRGLPIRGYGTMMLLAVLAGTGLAMWRAKRMGLDADLVVSLAFWLFIPGIVGARVFYLIEYWPEHYWPIYQEYGWRALLASLANVAQGGLVVYGAFLGALVGLALFARRYRLPFLVLGDLLAPSAMLGLALGRIGCVMNGCCFGGLCDRPWAITFPPDSPVHFHQVEHGQTFLHGLRLGSDADGSPLVAEVQPGSAAERAGLRALQHVTAINGQTTRTVRGAALALMSADKLSIATAGTPQAAQWTIEGAASPGPLVRSPAELRQIEEGKRTLYGLRIGPDSRGRPILLEVEPGSEAARQGLKPGQEITEINASEVETVAQAARALARADWLSIATKENPQGAVWLVEPRSLGSEPVAPVHPTQLYSTLDAMLLCLLLLAYAPFQRRDGELFALMLSIYPVSRFLVEMIRCDESGVFGTDLSISQNISLVLLATAVVVWYAVIRQPLQRMFPESASA